jgi:hypothetical protein
MAVRIGISNALCKRMLQGEEAQRIHNAHAKRHHVTGPGYAASGWLDASNAIAVSRRPHTVPRVATHMEGNFTCRTRAFE